MTQYIEAVCLRWQINLSESTDSGYIQARLSHPYLDTHIRKPYRLSHLHFDSFKSEPNFVLVGNCQKLVTNRQQQLYRCYLLRTN